jgi:hypothetical protein
MSHWNDHAIDYDKVLNTDLSNVELLATAVGLLPGDATDLLDIGSGRVAVDADRGGGSCSRDGVAGCFEVRYGLACHVHRGDGGGSVGVRRRQL